MKVVRQEATMEPVDTEALMKKLERIGRVCWKSEDKIADDSCDDFVRKLVKRGHESVLEHVSITVTVKVNRAIAQEITRHRIGSYSHESTRYVKYGEVEIIPSFEDKAVVEALELMEILYGAMLDSDYKPEIARDILPLCLASTLVMTYNLRQWRHFLKVRYTGTTGRPHPQIRELGDMVLVQMKEALPVIFADIPFLGKAKGKV